MSLTHNVSLFAVLVLIMAGCAAPQAPEAEAAGSPADRERPQAVGMANPASVHCQGLDGRLEIRTGTDGGQYGMCHLPDGRTCEEWALYRDGECISEPEG